MSKLRLLRAFMLIACALSLLTALAQEKRITGTVTDENGTALVGATVAVKDSRVQTTTDATGKFALNAPADARTLVVTYVGMVAQEMAIGNNNSFAVSLRSNTTTMSDVVVVGYGRARRVNLASAQTTVTAKELERTVNTTLEQAIQGRAAGVYITQNSGQPGGGISVNIRGVSSINNKTEPLYVIDGVQMEGQAVSFGSTSSSNPMAGLNPSDIENVEILQGPSATAIYGSRATNGVILITTKRGKAGVPKLNYNYQYNVQTPPRRLDVMNLPQYAQMRKEYHSIAGGTTPEEFLDPSILGPGTDWQNELFNNAPMNKHQLSLSGGNQVTTYYMSGEYLKQQGVAQGSGFDRYGFRLNIDNKPWDWLSLGANLSFNQTKEDLTTSQENIISNALRLTPHIPVRDMSGNWGGGDTIIGSNQYAPINPIAIANLVSNESTRRQFMGGINLGLNLMKGLTFRSSFNTNIGNNNSVYYIPTYSIGKWHVNPTASLTDAMSSNTYWNWNQLLEYNKQLDKHNISAMVSHEAQESNWKNTPVMRTGFLTNDIINLRAGTASTTTLPDWVGAGEWAMESYFGRLSYNYDNRYIFTGTYRRDGSVYFGPDKRWGSFPAISAAWRVSQEDFFNVPLISELKLRFETGLTGNQGNGSGIYATMVPSASQWGTVFQPGSYTNPNLQWEETRTNNFGINLGLLKNRINIEADYYIKDITNLNMLQVLPWYMGTSGVGSVAPPTVNAGNMQTKGWGITFNTTNIVKKDFRWESNLNLSHYKTKIVSLNTEDGYFDRSSWWMDNWTQRSAVGQQPWLFRGYVVEGVFQTIDEIKASAVPVNNSGRIPIDQANGVWVGDLKFKDMNEDGIIDVKDMTTIGNPWPKLFGGFTNSFSYKNFDLSVLITGTYGNDVYNYLARVNSNPNNINLSRNLMIGAMDYARVGTDANGNPYLLNPGTKVPRISTNIANGNYDRIHNLWVEDGSFLRLKNVSLSYNLPSSLISKQKWVKGIRATVSGQNLYTLTNYSGLDPEVGAYIGRDASAGNQAIGVDFGRYPLTPIYSFSVGVNF